MAATPPPSPAAREGPEPPPSRRVRLGDLLGAPRLGAIELASGDPSLWIQDIVDDSRAAAPGALFVAVPGTTADGRNFLDAALAGGAAAALVGLREGESLGDVAAAARWRASGRPLVVSRDVRRDLAILAMEFFGRPDHALTLVGVTGTNGKSTTVCLIRQIVQGTGRRAAELGTLGWRAADGAYVDLGNTTPGPVTLARLMRRLVDDGVTLLAMETSSHAIHQRRVFGFDYDVCVFTNLTHDHLDYHGTVEEYAAVKRGWIDACLAARPDTALVVNLDDAVGREIAAAHAGHRRLWTYGLDLARRPRLLAEKLRPVPGGTTAMFRLGSLPRTLEYPLSGLFNAQNVLAALGACLAAGIGEGEACRELTLCAPPPGRFERLDAGQPFTIIVDYAHTPDALERVLDNARGLLVGFERRRDAAEMGGARAGIAAETSGHSVKAPPAEDSPNGTETGAARTTARLVVVFGCGGDRDRAKRPRMGGAAAARADVVYVTSDNPRSEDPAAIMTEIRGGIAAREGLELHMIPDRAEAIRAAIMGAQRGDIVVLAGKGHEDYQEVAGVKHPFCDHDHARAAAAAWLERHGPR